MKIIHYHIFKNAGTSIDDALREVLDSRLGFFEGKHAHDVQNSSAVNNYFLEHPSILAVSTHLGRPPPCH